MTSAAELPRPLPLRRRAWQGVKAIADRGPGTPIRINEIDTIPIQQILTRVAAPQMRPPRTPTRTTTVVAPIDPLDVIKRVQAGEREAFGLLFDHYHAMIYKYVIFRVGNRQTAEDLTSDTFLRALKRIDSFTWQGRDPGAWLVTIARNLVADHYKSARHRWEFYPADVLDFDRPDHDPNGSPETAAVDHDTSRILLAAIRKLTPDQQDVIALRFLHGFSPAETAQAMGKGEKAVNALLYRALRTLAKLLPDGLRP